MKEKMYFREAAEESVSAEIKGREDFAGLGVKGDIEQVPCFI